MYLWSHYFYRTRLSCLRGGFTILRHNNIRDFTANVLSDACHNVSVEPHLQPLSGEKFTGASAITDDGARLDIAATASGAAGTSEPFLTSVSSIPLLPQTINPFEHATGT